ncbi:MAG: hypothetical protein A2147_11700 [Chloroflexi bacterium RBG_16_57_8]|nr:MAG: hypothetical protein A2147_11700 [Chloroflexi bacterium RBG_16_57_8]
MGDIRSAREIALEKVERLGEATQEERLQWKYRPGGEQLAHRYLKDDENLIAGVSRFDEEARRYVRAGAAEVLSRSIALPKNDFAKNLNRKAMEGLRLIKTDKAQLENTFSRMRQLFNHYLDQGEKQRRQAHQQLKVDFEARIRPELEKQQFGSFQRMEIDVEKLPQFQQEWRKVLNQLDSQYLLLLKEYKEGLEALQ